MIGDFRQAEARSNVARLPVPLRLQGYAVCPECGSPRLGDGYEVESADDHEPGCKRAPRRVRR